jgi:hypothetical protein
MIDLMLAAVNILQPCRASTGLRDSRHVWIPVMEEMERGRLNHCQWQEAAQRCLWRGSCHEHPECPENTDVASILN